MYKNTKPITIKAMHILSAEQFDKDQLGGLFDHVDKVQDDYYKDRAALAGRHLGKRAAILFYEPSTRTQTSFEHAALSLGAGFSSRDNAGEFSSAAKGETIEDTMHMLNAYHVDVAIIRHDETGGVRRAAEVAEMPVINAGDGAGEHPTQALLDIYTIQQQAGRAHNLNVVIGGDLLHGRTARSLAKMLAQYENNRMIFTSIPELQIADDIKNYLREREVEFEETDDMQAAFKEADVVYWTRLQKERLPAGLAISKSFIIDQAAMEGLPDHAIVMHPLPRVDEITTEVDNDPRAKYFKQAENGMWLRMALLDQLLSEEHTTS